MTLKTLRNFAVLIPALVGLGFLGKWALNLYRAADEARTEAALAWALRDSTNVTLAATKADRDRYRKLFELAGTTGAKPVAGTRIIVQRWDTVFLHDSVPTVTQPDGTRTAVFSDSTRQAVVRTYVTAPPCCAPLEGRVEVTLPADTPTVGFLKAGKRVVAVVDWQGRQVRAEAPFFVQSGLPRWTSFVEVLGDPQTATVRGGTNLRVIGGWSLSAAVDQRFAAKEQPRMGVGIRYTF